MQNQEQEKTIQEQLQEKLGILAKITPESLVRTDDLGKALDFRDGVVQFKLTLDLFRNLKEVKLDGFPDQRLQNLLNLASGAIVIFENILKFQSTQSNPVEARNNLIQQVKNKYEDQHNEITQVIAYAYAKGTDFKSLMGEAKIAVSKAEEEVKKAENSSKQIEGILTAARKAAPVIGVEKYADIFQNEADAHKKKADSWLIATAVLAGLTLILAVVSIPYYIEVIKAMNTSQSIQVGLAKLVILAVFYFGIVWSGKIYKAQQHNCVVNQHRRNALATFETFVNAAGDKETKNAVLIQTTKAIFSPQHTGFAAHEKELSTSPQILEIIRGAISEGE